MGRVEERGMYNLLNMTWYVLYNRLIRAKSLSTCRHNS